MTIRKHTLLYIPHSGLFFNGREFVDGEGNTINWNRNIPIFSSHYTAEQSKDKLLASHPAAYNKGRVIILNVGLVGKPEDLNLFERAGNWPEL